MTNKRIPKVKPIQRDEKQPLAEHTDQSEDVRQKIRDLTKTVPPTAREIQAFRKRRSTMVRHANLFSDEISGALPPPGGVGEGVFFINDQFTFNDATGIYWYAIAPRTLGGNPQPLLYLTASNHASKGPEALVSYQDGAEGVFRVWDWATPAQADNSHFVVGIARKDWGPYVVPYEFEGVTYETLYISNLTYRVSDNNWRNEVYLFNDNTGKNDLIWAYDFVWEPTGDIKYFDWGPIIETFPPYGYGTTNEIGYAESVLLQDQSEFSLTPDNSYMRNDGQGFEIKKLVPNYTLLAE